MPHQQYLSRNFSLLRKQAKYFLDEPPGSTRGRHLCLIWHLFHPRINWRILQHSGNSATRGFTFERKVTQVCTHHISTTAYTHNNHRQRKCEGMLYLICLFVLEDRSVWPSHKIFMFCKIPKITVDRTSKTALWKVYRCVYHRNSVQPYRLTWSCRDWG